MRRVDVGEHDVAVDPRDDLLDLRERGHHRGHRPGVLHPQARHLAPARADGLDRILERQRSGADERPVLADRVTHDEIGSDPVLAQQARQRGVDGDHGRLLDLGAAELLLGPRHRVRIRRVGEHDVRQAATLQQRSHDRIGLLEQLRDDGLPPAQLGEHVRVLGALAGVQERHLAGAAAAAVDAACAQRRPCGGVARLQHAQSQLRLRHQVGAVGVVDRDPLGRAQRVAAGRRRIEVASLACLRQLGAERVGEPRLVRRAEHERPAQRRLGRRGGLRSTRGDAAICAAGSVACRRRRGGSATGTAPRSDGRWSA